MRNKVFTIFLLVLSIIAGLYSVSSIPKELYPEIKVPVIIVSTIYPGASATEVEETVTNSLENVLIGGLTGVKEITSSSREGVSVIAIEFVPSADANEVLLDVKDRVEAKQGDLPTDAIEPIVTKVNFTDQPIYTVALSSQLAFNELRTRAEEIEDELLTIPGVSDVSVSGIPEREITVLLDPQKLSQYSVSPNDVVRAIGNAKRTLPIGSIIFDEREYSLDFFAGIDDAEDIGNVIIDNRIPGTTLYVRELVQSIEDGVSTYTSNSRISSDGSEASQQAIVFNVKKQEGGNILDLTKEIEAKLQTYAEDRPAENINFVVLFDAGKEIQTNLSDLVRSGVQTVLLVLLVMGLMVGFRESIIASLAIPLSFLLAFIGMNLVGQTINFITLFSLIIVIGILIDSAIVVVEGIHDFTAEGQSLEQAIESTIREFGKPIIAGMLTTISIFVPLMLLSGVTGQFIGGIPRVINIVLIVSVFVALVFIPIISIMLAKVTIPDPKIIKKYREKTFNTLSVWYAGLLERLLNNSKAKRKLVWVLIALFFSSFVLVGAGLIKSEFFPSEAIDRVYIDFETKQGTVLEETSRLIAEVEKIVAKQIHITSFSTTIGSTNPFNENGGTGSHFAHIIGTIDDKKNGRVTESDLREAFSGINEYSVQVFTPENGPPVGPPFQLKVSGNDWDDITVAAEAVAQLARTFPSARNVDSGVDTGVIDIRLNVIPERLAEYGLTSFDVSSILRTAIFGTEATSLQVGAGSDVQVMVKVALNSNARSHRESNQITFDQIKSIPVNTSVGEVLLGYFVEEELTQATSVARHIDGVKTKTVTAFTRDGFLPVDIVSDFEKRANELELPEGVEYSIGGSTDEGAEALKELVSSLGFGVLLIFGVLIWQFGSLRSVIVILSVIPLGLIGVLYGLFFFGMTLSFTALLGFVALVGVVVNDSIILVDVMGKLRVRNPELTKYQAIIKGATMRLRPVILTTATTVLGMVPLIFVSATWKPFAFSIIFGLSFATVLTLLLVPILYGKIGK